MQTSTFTTTKILIFLLYLPLLAVLSSSALGSNEKIASRTHFELRLPEEYEGIEGDVTRNVVTQFVQMPLDHFDPHNNASFAMRYMANDEFFGGPGSPIFIMIGGEWAISTGWLLTGNMYECARENSGYQIYTEHRYYGQTLPYSNFTTENLRWLTVDQALADLAYFINYLKSQSQFENSKVIMYGGSYAANMAIWFKKRYPHLVEGVLASSGPVLGKVDYHEYLETVHEAFESEGGSTCIDTIREGIEDTVQALYTEEGRALIQQVYRLCNPLDFNNKYDIGYFAGLITWTFSGTTQSARPGNHIAVCNNFATDFYGTTPMEKIAGYIAISQGLGSSCWSNYSSYLNSLQSSSTSRAWYYQTCTEFAFFQIAPSSGTVFDGLAPWLDADFYIDICREAFDPRFDELFVRLSVEAANIKYGGLNARVSRAVNVHGVIDPWHKLGVLQDISDDSPTVVVPRASHCFDMQPWLTTDTPRMTAAQQQVRRSVAEWLRN